MEREELCCEQPSDLNDYIAHITIKNEDVLALFGKAKEAGSSTTIVCSNILKPTNENNNENGVI